MIEKSVEYGGTSAVSGCGMWIPNNHRISALGGSDSAEEAIVFIKAVTHGEVDGGRIELYVEHGREMTEHLEQHTRACIEAQSKYADYYPEVAGGKPGYRSMDPQPFDAAVLAHARAPRPAPW